MELGSYSMSINICNEKHLHLKDPENQNVKINNENHDTDFLLHQGHCYE